MRQLVAFILRLVFTIVLTNIDALFEGWEVIHRKARRNPNRKLKGKENMQISRFLWHSKSFSRKKKGKIILIFYGSRERATSRIINFRQCLSSACDANSSEKSRWTNSLFSQLMEQQSFKDRQTRIEGDKENSHGIFQLVITGMSQENVNTKNCWWRWQKLRHQSCFSSYCYQKL